MLNHTDYFSDTDVKLWSRSPISGWLFWWAEKLRFDGRDHMLALEQIKLNSFWRRLVIIGHWFWVIRL